ncbi:MAG: hypothetical protein IJW32_03735 [Clostridia bacterium]|nr:hypothetical protein [Clostridia bacterium]
MEEQNNNKRKTKLLMFTMIAIIAILLAGIIYQFVVIKSLQKQVSENTSSYVYVQELSAKENKIN